MNGAVLRRAIAEYFIEGFEDAEIQRQVSNTPELLRVDAYESMRPRRIAPAGCKAWIRHLIWLERMLEISKLPLAAVEAEGLSLLKQERGRFQQEHPACPECGMPNTPHAFTCRECFAQIKG